MNGVSQRNALSLIPHHEDGLRASERKLEPNAVSFVMLEPSTVDPTSKLAGQMERGSQKRR